MAGKKNLLKEEAIWIEENIRPDIYAVATLKQAIGFKINGVKIWKAGNPSRYDIAFARTIADISRAIFKKANRRFNKRVAIATTLEGDGSNVRYHVNFLLRKPDHVTFEDFRDIFLTQWHKNEWAMPDIEFKLRTGNCVAYSLKEGPDSLLPLSTGF